METTLPVKDVSSPTILYANVRSVLQKLDELRYTLPSNHIDIFACSESWLNEKHDDNVISIIGYKVYREDRKHRIGGGVAVWIGDSIPVCRLHCDHPLQFECLSLHLTSFGILLLVVYIPPEVAIREESLANDFVINHVDEIQNRFPNIDIILCGDMNRLKTSTLTNSLNLNDIHKKPTYGDAQLDYVLLSDALINRYVVTHVPPILVDTSKTADIALLASPRKQLRCSV